MLGLGYQELLLLVILIGIPVAIGVAGRQLAKKYPVERGGIGGWLLVIGIGAVVTPLLLVRHTWNLVRQATWSEMDPDEIATTAAGIGLIGGLLVAWAISNAVLFFRRRRAFPWAWIALNGLLTLMAGAGALLDAASTAGLGIVFLWTAMWGVYLRRSQRVKNTFTR